MPTRWERLDSGRREPPRASNQPSILFSRRFTGAGIRLGFSSERNHFRGVLGARGAGLYNDFDLPESAPNVETLGFFQDVPSGTKQRRMPLPRKTNARRKCV